MVRAVLRGGGQRRFTLAMLGFGMLALVGCMGRHEGPASKGTNQGEKRRLVWALRGNAEVTDPAMVADTDSGFVVAQVCEGLVRFEEGSSKVIPALAESEPEISADGTRWKFRLRRGVTFHDGTPLTAEAVRFSFMRQMDPTHPYYVAGRMTAARRLFGDPTTTESVIVRDIETPDDWTVVFVLAQPRASFARNLAVPQAAIVSPRAVMNAAADGQTTMVGTGPFRVAGVRPGRSIVLERNPQYWGEPPRIESVELRMISEAVERERALRQQQCDVAAGLPPQTLAKLARSKEFMVTTAPGMTGCVLLLNHAVPPLDSARVRRGIALAIGREKLMRDLLLEYADAGYGWLPPAMVEAAHPDAQSENFGDVNEAKRLFAEAGVPGGFTVKLMALTVPRVYNPAGAAVAEKVAQDLTACGLTVILERVPLEVASRRVAEGDYQMAVWGAVAWNGDPSAYWADLFGDGQTNALNYRSGELHALLRQLETEIGEPQRKATCAHIEKLLHAEIPCVPLFYARQAVVARREVRIEHLNVMGLTRLDKVGIVREE
ncbi:MAG: ABC transporter substrate-binding protein [Candidatus Sumerlaea sp.]|nr:MAG: ABC transporter substrate-binding protein [Candidatus Sumerlaea sp.]